MTMPYFDVIFCRAKKIRLAWFTWVPNEIRAVEDTETETFYTKSILLNEGIHAWMVAEEQPHEKLTFPEEVLLRGNAFWMELKL